jgi:Peptidase family M1 domain
MNVKTAVCSLFLMCALGAIGQQQPELQKRPQQTDAANPAPPAAMPPPEKLEPARVANANPLYQALRTRAVNGPAFTVKNLSLKRDAGEFTFSDGTFYFYGEVNGLVTGAVFLGAGTLHVDPPSVMERRQLKLVMKTEVLNQPFTSAVFAFTDGTAAELLKGRVASASTSGTAVAQAQEAQTLFRKNLKHDMEGRLLEDVVQPGKGEFFLADMKGPMFSKRLIYVVDPHGAIGVEPEGVALLTSSDQGYDIALGFRSEEQRRRATATKTNSTFRIPQQTIDVTIEKNGKMTGTAVSVVTAVESDTRVLPLMLAPTLRVSGVWGPNGEALDYVQEDKNRDADFAVVLQKPLKAGETIQITTAYVGKDVVLDMGSGNYYLVARESWYPNVRGSLGNYAYYSMKFHTPKDVQVIATGNRVKEREEGQQKISEWQTMTPIAVAGFNMGQFKSDQSERNKDVQVVTYANTSLADNYSGLPDSKDMALGTLSTTGMLKVATSEGDAAIQIYTDFFGPLPYDHVSLTQQTACNYGQSWPTLVYLPVCYFWDGTVQHQLGLLDHDPSYWKVVTAHEVAHQWWGQTVGFDNYRDQWMSEGFADFSASLFLLETRKDQKEYRDFWALLRRRLLEKNAAGVRPVDVGPVVMGSRVSTSRSGGDVYQMLIYPKGAYILHSLQMLFFTPKYGDAPFKAAMHDFVKSYRNKAATTEDFKAVMERNMPPWMDIQKNHKLDWFFDAYVYGTEVPKYSITSTFEKKGDDTTLHFTVTQSGVSDDFTMLVPVYIEFADKRVSILGYVTLKGAHSADQVVNLGKLAVEPKRMLVNYNNDLLSD